MHSQCIVYAYTFYSLCEDVLSSLKIKSCYILQSLLNVKSNGFTLYSNDEWLYLMDKIEGEINLVETSVSVLLLAFINNRLLSNKITLNILKNIYIPPFCCFYSNLEILCEIMTISIYYINICLITIADICVIIIIFK